MPPRTLSLKNTNRKYRNFSNRNGELFLDTHWWTIVKAVRRGRSFSVLAPSTSSRGTAWINVTSIATSASESSCHVKYSSTSKVTDNQEDLENGDLYQCRFLFLTECLEIEGYRDFWDISRNLSARLVKFWAIKKCKMLTFYHTKRHDTMKIRFRTFKHIDALNSFYFHGVVHDSLIDLFWRVYLVSYLILNFFEDVE